ncbi:class I poly(R)-hydroxyalkanoic acid synthase [Pusillimonas sp. CC-YST705]|uniref:Class I poly(R)-hydroxyalkanoic acid synthase n=1 Tax=Mesopusillimonas faecipullorum TaxID=2755040 RepID=A0ABS8CD21_9BURK|nr:class I poly(R)-hydroxyalkanoic acid synthase [Mesopusillimonas faecipullorum]MCB5363927.1 class I poly(R)-hydroxyalkanoic acid synthase [Mesopusillimonas faecipullorum]
MKAPQDTDWPMPLGIPPEALVEIQAQFSRGWQKVLAAARDGSLASPSDRRFRAQAWSANQGAMLMAHAYLLSAHAMQSMVESAQMPEPMRDRMRFGVQQWLDAWAPSNFLATNPDALQTLLDSKGQSLLDGLNNFMHDVQQGRMSQTDESGFEVGGNLAITPGQVIYENHLMQVIQYEPLTPTVHQRPLLMVPPCINKYYILDLQPENSFVRYALESGFRVFLVSWRNPLPDDDDGILSAGWSDYLKEGVLQAIEVVQGVTRQPKINALGFCVGGTLLSSALALAHAQGDDPVASLTLLTTLLDFKDPGILEVFIDELHVQTRERQMGKGGLMTARELATTFSFLRPNELVWNYVVSNYLKGEVPPPFDLLYWNSDGTNLPGPFFAWYLRNAYLENRLKEPGAIEIDGHRLNFGVLDMPAYVYGSREDHIVPWRSAYASTALLKGPQRFVLGASGHIAGVINPPKSGRRSYWAHDEIAYGCDQIPADPQQWLEQAQEHRGSWWPDWAQWMASHSGPKRKAVKTCGNAKFSPIEAAPGRYAKVRAL